LLFWLLPFGSGFFPPGEGMQVLASSLVTGGGDPGLGGGLSGAHGVHSKSGSIAFKAPGS